MFGGVRCRLLLEPLMAAYTATSASDTNRAQDVFGVEPTPFAEAAQAAIAAMPDATV